MREAYNFISITTHDIIIIILSIECGGEGGVWYIESITNHHTFLLQNVVVSVVREVLPGSVAALMLVWLRVRISPYTPSFTAADNPAAHAPELTTRLLSIAHSWAVHARLLVWPATLSFDWSQGAVPLVTHLADPSNIETVALLACLLVLALMSALACWRARLSSSTPKFPTYQSHPAAYHDLLNNNLQIQADGGNSCLASCSSQWPRKTPRGPLLVIAAWALLVVPFLPASNLPAYVGFVVAERVLYLPSMGACLLVALGSQALWRVLPHAPPPPSGMFSHHYSYDSILHFCYISVCVCVCQVL